MATRATISYFDEGTKKYHSIYLHNDGYLEDAGKILKEHYSSLEKVKKLVALGSISILGGSTVKGSTFAHHRDRGDEWEDNEPLVTARLKKADRQEFNYLFLNGEWNYIEEHGRRWRLVP
jgi:hypothetical protein